MRKGFAVLFNVGIAGVIGGPAVGMLTLAGLEAPRWLGEGLFWLSLAMPAGLVLGLAWLVVSRGSGERPRAGEVVRIVLSVPLSVLVVGWLGCAAPRGQEAARTEVRRPGMIPIVYAANYEIHIMGIEKQFVFDVNKYPRIRDELIKEGLRKREDFRVPEPLSEEQLLRVHTKRYWEEIQDPGRAARYLEFPAVATIPGPVYRERGLASFVTAGGGTLLAARKALEHGLAINLAGGYAHAWSDGGGGFCLIADVPIAVRILQKEGKVKRVLVIDTDCHHGEGNGKEFACDDAVRVVDFYQEEIYPSVKEKVWRNVSFAAGISDEGYMKLLEANVPSALDEHKPELVMFVMGSDIYEGDPLTTTNISKETVLKRDLYVVGECRKRGIPVAMTLSGGYSKESWRIHADSIAAIVRTYEGLR